MTTYNTYQECKIANPESDIYRYFSELYGIFFNVKVNIDGIEGVRRALCNPADYCITVEKFLADGHKFVEGDVVMAADCTVIIVASSIVADAMSEKSHHDFENYILRAAALETKPEAPFLQTGEDFEHSKTLNFIRDRLVEVHGENANYDYMHKLSNAIAFVENIENAKLALGGNDSLRTDVVGEEKPKRTKVDWEQVHHSEAVHYFSVEGFHLYDEPNGSKYNELQDYINNLQDNGTSSLYRCIETEITEREEFIERCIEATDDDHGSESSYYQGWFKCLYDNGCRFVD